MALTGQKIDAMTETERLEKEIGDRIDAAVKADPRQREEIAAALGMTPGALQKIQDGKSTTQFAKLAHLATVLRRSPNELLGLDDTGDRAVLRGAIEGACEGAGYPQKVAQALALVVLKVIDTPEAGDPSPNPLERAHAIAKFLTQQSVDLQRK
jgi:transcriptional regulator with XRE-family HTH domain